MAQTKRKRRNKHRGNAVGIVEARGRTSKPREGAAKSSGGRGASARGGSARPIKPPTFQSAMIKALIGCVILFIFFRFLGNGTSTGGALTMCVVAFVLYAPLMYVTDKWIYKRKLRAQAGGAGAGARR